MKYRNLLKKAKNILFFFKYILQPQRISSPSYSGKDRMWAISSLRKKNSWFVTQSKLAGI